MSANKGHSIKSIILLLLASIVATGIIAFIALERNETINALWIVICALCVYFIGYRYYSLYIAKYAMRLDSTRMTPAFRHYDGLDYVPTNKVVLFGHHFAAIAGAGPLVGPVLAAQLGYFPGMLWIMVGVVLAGAVQDFMVLFISMRHDGKSLGEMLKDEMGYIPGVISMISFLIIMIIILAVLAMVVVKAATHSPWTTFTLAYTIPLALLMGIYLRYIRPGKIFEISVVGFALLILGIVLGGWVSQQPDLSRYFDLSGETLTLCLIGYGFLAAVLPVWLLLAPRDYLSTFLKLGTIFILALAVIVLMPDLKMPAVTRFIDGTGPVWSGPVFPFLFITIACGSVSGFHSLICSGTTPKMISNEVLTRPIGYGAMILESRVAIIALIAASIIDPGIYFVMNSPESFLNPQGLADNVFAASQTISNLGFVITPETIQQMTKDVGEASIISRTGGAPTLAMGMAHFLHQAMSGLISMPFWYHFAILFEALFILTTVDAGSRAGRFMLQDFLGLIHPKLKKTDYLPANLLATAVIVCAWGYFLYQGVVDPLGGINTLWPLFGIAGQMLAALALTLCTVILFKMKRNKYA